MGVFTISVKDEIEEKLRKLAIARFSKRKGYLSRAITEAVEDWADKEDNLAVEKGLELLNKGLKLGGIVNKNRNEWHRRK